MSYENFVINSYKQTARTLDEAYHTAEYCSAIEKPRYKKQLIPTVLLTAAAVISMFIYIAAVNAEESTKKSTYGKTVKAISDKYNKDPIQVAHIVNTAVEVSENKGLDPVLTLAVIATESEFNPKAYNKVTGASGLTQVLAGMHDKLIKSYRGSIFDPLVSIEVGTDLMKTYIAWSKGNTKKGMNQYGGDSTGAYYNKVMTNYKWIDKTIERDL